MNAADTPPAFPDDLGSGSALRRRMAWHRMPPTIKACLLLGLLLGLGALFAPWIGPHDPVATSILEKLKPPFFLEGYEGTYWLGTDQLGRDLFSRCLHGIRVSVGIALLGLIVSALVGTAAGLFAGLLGGWVDRLVMLVVDVFITVPFLLLVLVGIKVFLVPLGIKIDTAIALAVTISVLASGVLYSLWRTRKEDALQSK